MSIRTMLFFFSSRRRHTRYWRDWSSDVCSSDLITDFPARSASHRSFGHESEGTGPGLCTILPANFLELRTREVRRIPLPRRSEERRVGKSVDLGGRRIIKKKM